MSSYSFGMDGLDLFSAPFSTPVRPESALQRVATVPVQDDAAKRKAHEEESLQKLNAMSDADIGTVAASRVRTDTERLIRKNMKECVSEHIQTLCGRDPAFARKVMHPRKTVIHCFKYINRMAKEYVKQEMEELDIRPDGGGYGCDIPDGLVYRWAEDYFNSMDALEDQEKEEPKPYTETSTKTAKPVKKSNKTSEKQQKKSDTYEQMSLEGVIG